MAHLEDIQKAQNCLRERFDEKLNELHAQLHTGGTAKDTVAKVAEEFRTFRELMYAMLKMLQNAIDECAKSADVLETRQRRKAIVFSGVREAEGENLSAVISNILQDKLGVKDITASSLKVCHRLGSMKQGHNRPILVRFASYDVKAAVWRAKKGLKGSSVSVKEFLTPRRQGVFAKARLHFGLRGTWTQDGVIIIKATDGTRHRITSMDELKPLLVKYPSQGATSKTGGTTTKS